MVETDRIAQRLSNSLRGSTSNIYRKVSVAVLSVVVFLLFAFSTNIPWYMQTLSGGLSSVDNAILNSIASVYIAGFTSFTLTVIYSIVSGFALTAIFLQLRNSRISGKGLGSILPGFVATGCASCGVGLTGVIGLTGLTAALPFQGDLFKVGGILLLIYALYDIGDPEVCRVSSG